MVSSDKKPKYLLNLIIDLINLIIGFINLLNQ